MLQPRGKRLGPRLAPNPLWAASGGSGTPPRPPRSSAPCEVLRQGLHLDPRRPGSPPPQCHSCSSNTFITSCKFQFTQKHSWPKSLITANTHPARGQTERRPVLVLLCSQAPQAVSCNQHNTPLLEPVTASVQHSSQPAEGSKHPWTQSQPSRTPHEDGLAPSSSHSLTKGLKDQEDPHWSTRLRSVLTDPGGPEWRPRKASGDTTTANSGDPPPGVTPSLNSAGLSPHPMDHRLASANHFTAPDLCYRSRSVPPLHRVGGNEIHLENLHQNSKPQGRREFQAGTQKPSLQTRHTDYRAHSWTAPGTAPAAHVRQSSCAHHGHTRTTLIS